MMSCSFKYIELCLQLAHVIAEGIVEKNCCRGIDSIFVGSVSLLLLQGAASSLLAGCDSYYVMA